LLLGSHSLISREVGSEVSPDGHESKPGDGFFPPEKAGNDEKEPDYSHYCVKALEVLRLQVNGHKKTPSRI
jgi:hypothetical protein